MHDGSGATHEGQAAQNEVVQQVACGKAHSLAVTVHGDLYAWGKGWRGELGSR